MEKMRKIIKWKNLKKNYKHFFMEKNFKN
jgi:hypothetical protein